MHTLCLPPKLHSVFWKYPTTLAQLSPAQRKPRARERRGRPDARAAAPVPVPASTQDAQRPPRAGRRRGRAGDEGHRAAALSPRSRAGSSAAVSSPAPPLRHQDLRSARMRQRPPLVFIPGEPGHAPPPQSPPLPVPPRPALARPGRKVVGGARRGGP